VLSDRFILYFSTGAFMLTLTPFTALLGGVTGVGMGLLGVIAPAIRCLTPPLPSALRAA